jgi:AraC-like DNA-binding protein
MNLATDTCEMIVTIHEVAERVGYESQASFTNAFSVAFHCPKGIQRAAQTKCLSTGNPIGTADTRAPTDWFSRYGFRQLEPRTRT